MKNVLDELMRLVENYGDACEHFGDYQTCENALLCGEAKKKIEEFAKLYLTNN